MLSDFSLLSQGQGEVTLCVGCCCGGTARAQWPWWLSPRVAEWRSHVGIPWTQWGCHGTLGGGLDKEQEWSPGG